MPCFGQLLGGGGLVGLRAVGTSCVGVCVCVSLCVCKSEVPVPLLPQGATGLGAQGHMGVLIIHEQIFHDVKFLSAVLSRFSSLVFLWTTISCGRGTSVEPPTFFPPFLLLPFGLSSCEFPCFPPPL